MVLPVPGGPINRRLCPPAAVISSARFPCSCPIISLRSSGASAITSSHSSGSDSSCRPSSQAQTSCKCPAMRHPFSAIRLTSDAFSLATMICRPARMASRAPDIAPGTPLNAPVSASSPTNSYEPSRVVLSCSEAARRAIAIGKSYRPPSLGKSAGARLMVIFFAGKV